ncbi:MAG: hypothetical protein INQ03_08975 [Candidatus Heimdallarchaeota archaeon]|nr:hypothetical protein [Candidatus Heimdallarchaeota archaeon]
MDRKIRSTIAKKIINIEQEDVSISGYDAETDIILQVNYSVNSTIYNPSKTMIIRKIEEKGIIDLNTKTGSMIFIDEPNINYISRKEALLCVSSLNKLLSYGSTSTKNEFLKVEDIQGNLPKKDENKLKQAISQNYSKKVRYIGGNNRHYTKLTEPKISDITIDDISVKYLITNRVQFNINGNEVTYTHEFYNLDYHLSKFPADRACKYCKVLNSESIISNCRICKEIICQKSSCTQEFKLLKKTIYTCKNDCMKRYENLLDEMSIDERILEEGGTSKQEIRNSIVFLSLSIILLSILFRSHISIDIFILDLIIILILIVFGGWNYQLKRNQMIHEIFISRSNPIGSKAIEETKPRGFSDIKDLHKAKKYGISNYNEFERYYDEIIAGNFPNKTKYLDAISKNFTSYSSYRKATNVGIDSFENYKAHYEKLKNLGFNSYEDYQNAIDNGFRDNAQYQIALKYKLPNIDVYNDYIEILLEQKISYPDYLRKEDINAKVEYQIFAFFDEYSKDFNYLVPVETLKNFVLASVNCNNSLIITKLIELLNKNSDLGMLTPDRKDIMISSKKVLEVENEIDNLIDEFERGDKINKV